MRLTAWGWGADVKAPPGCASVRPRPWRGLLGVRPAARPLPRCPGPPRAPWGRGWTGAAVSPAAPGLWLRVVQARLPPRPLCPDWASPPGDPQLPYLCPDSLFVSLVGVGGLRPHLMRGVWSPSVEGVRRYGLAMWSVLGFHSPSRCDGPCHPSLSPRAVPQCRPGFVLHRRVGAPGRAGGPRQRQDPGPLHSAAQSTEGRPEAAWTRRGRGSQGAPPGARPPAAASWGG